MKAKVLITGGAGFIGTSLAKYLLGKGLAVKTFDMYEPRNRICEHHVGTIMFPHDLDRAMRGYDYVVHLAAILGVRRTERERTQCLDINIIGTKNVLDACAKARVKKVVFASSSEVYGNAQRIPISESDPVSPNSVYAVTKLAGEEYVRAHSRMQGFRYSIVRLFNVYGPGQVAEFVLPRFVKSVLENIPPTVYGDGNQIRSFCHVTDAAQGIYLALDRKGTDNQVFNIGNDKTAITVADLAKKVISVSGISLKPRYIDMQDADRSPEREIINRVPDISKARTILRYRPTVSLDRGIKDLLKTGNIEETWFDPLTKK